jgi:hypothetical protein
VTFEIIEGLVFGASADYITEVEVLDRGSGHEVTQGLAVEVRRVAGVGSGAYIDQHLHAIPLKQFDEMLR